MPDRRLEWTNCCWGFSGVQPHSSCLQQNCFFLSADTSHILPSSFIRSAFYLTSCLDINYFPPSFFRQTSCTDGGNVKKKKKHLDRLWHQDCAAGLLVAALPLRVCVGMSMWARVLASSLSNILKVVLIFKCFNSLPGHMLPFFVLGGVTTVQVIVTISRKDSWSVSVSTRNVTAKPKICLTTAPSHKDWSTETSEYYLYFHDTLLLINMPLFWKKQ